MTDPDVERSVATEMALLDLWEMRSRKADTTIVYDYEDPPDYVWRWRVRRNVEPRTPAERLNDALDRADEIVPHPRHRRDDRGRFQPEDTDE